MPSSGSLDTRVWNFLEASILHVRSQKYCGIPYFFTNNSGIPHYFIMEFHIKNKLWKTEIKYYCPFIMNFHSCSEPRIVLNWGHMLYLRNSLDVVSIRLGFVFIEQETLVRPRAHCNEK